MERVTVECLSCGERREVTCERGRQVRPGECERCGYVGWANSSDMSELLRRVIRERPVERRRLRPI